MSGDGGYVRWMPAEWRALAAHAVKFVDSGKNAYEALFLSQREVLPTERQKPLGWLRANAGVWRISWTKYLEEVRKLSYNEREAITAPAIKNKKPVHVRGEVGRLVAQQAAAERRAAKEPEPVYAGARWTNMEWALIARHVQHRVQQGDQRTPAALIIEAQEVCLEAHRRRALGGIRKGDSHQHNKKRIEQALHDLWLIEKIPFAPDGEVLNPDDETSTDGTAESAPAHHSAGVPAATAALLAARLPAAGVSVPGPAPIQVGNVSEAAQVFGLTVMRALDSLLKVHAQGLLAQVEQDMRKQAQETANIMLAAMERGIKGVVHSALETELGGPVVPAPVAAPAAPPSATVTAETDRKSV